jgi:uncharacterized protein
VLDEKMTARAPVRRLERLMAIAFLAVIHLLFAGCATSASTRLATDRQARLLRAHTFDDLTSSAEMGRGMTPTGVWRVAGASNVVYLAATSHLVTSNQVPFPSTYYAAYRDAETLYVEVEDQNSKLAGIRLTFRLMKWIRKNQAEFFYPKGQSLADDASVETLSRLQEFYGRDFKKMLKMRPAFLVFMLQAQAMNEQSLQAGGVEDVFIARARADRKQVRELDDSSVDETVLLALDEMIYETKRAVETSGADTAISEALLRTKEPVDERSWRSGDLRAAQLEVDEMRTRTPALYEKIGPQRNRKWLPKIVASLKSGRSAMILAGIAHFPGEDGLIELLRRAGYQVHQLHGIDPLTKQEERTKD